jgi:hypothetical protein
MKVMLSPIHPNLRFSFFTGADGEIVATGTPRFVIWTDSPVLFTWSITARQVALNFEMAICSMALG